MGVVVRLTENTERYALMLALSQIVGRKCPCSYCDQPATLGIATGADNETDPLCYAHAMSFVVSAVNMAAEISGITSE